MATKPLPTPVKKTVAESPASVLVKTVAAPKASKLVPKPATTKKPVAKAVKPVKPKPQPKAVAKAVSKVKVRKPKLVRDSFTIPKPEYLVLDTLKARANAIASPAKKGELLRAGIKALAAMSDAAFLTALKAVPAIKTGRPVKV